MKGMFLATYTCRRHKKETFKQKQNYIEEQSYSILNNSLRNFIFFWLKKRSQIQATTFSEMV